MVSALPPLRCDVSEISAVEVAERGSIGSVAVVCGLHGWAEEGAQGDKICGRHVRAVGAVVRQEDIALVDGGTDKGRLEGEVSSLGASSVVGELGAVVYDGVKCQTGSCAVVRASLEEGDNLRVRHTAETVDFGSAVEVATAEGGGDEGEVGVLRVDRCELKEGGSGVHDQS